MENQVFWRRYIEISHSGEEQIPDPIYRGSDFQYTMPLWNSDLIREMTLWIDLVGFGGLYTSPGTHPRRFGTSTRHFSPFFFSSTSCHGSRTGPHDEIR